MQYLEIIVTSTAVACMLYALAAFARRYILGRRVYREQRQDAFWQYISETAAKRRQEELDFSQWDAEITQDYRTGEERQR